MKIPINGFLNFNRQCRHDPNVIKLGIPDAWEEMSIVPSDQWPEAVILYPKRQAGTLRSAAHILILSLSHAACLDGQVKYTHLRILVRQVIQILKAFIRG